MRAGVDPFSFLVISTAGWINQRQQQLIEYLVEENRVLWEQIGNRRMRFTDEPTSSVSSESKEARPESLSAGRNHRHTPDAAGLASRVNCEEL